MERFTRHINAGTQGVWSQVRVGVGDCCATPSIAWRHFALANSEVLLVRAPGAYTARAFAQLLVFCPPCACARLSLPPSGATDEGAPTSLAELAPPFARGGARDGVGATVGADLVEAATSPRGVFPGAADDTKSLGSAQQVPPA